MKKLLLISLVFVCFNAKSQDWQDIYKNGIDPVYSGVSHFFVDNNDNVYLRASNYSDANNYLHKIYRSTNQGGSWSLISSNGLEQCETLADIIVVGDKLLLSCITSQQPFSQTIMAANIANVTSVESPTTKEAWTTFPNPFSDQLSIKSNEQSPKWIGVSDMNGKKVAEIDNPKKIELLDTENWKSGTYIINAQDNDKYHYYRVVKP